VVGNISTDRRGGETIRDTYGDLILSEDNQVRYFEPPSSHPRPPTKPN